MTQQITIPLALLEQLVEALEGVETLIEHQYTGTREGMNALQNASDDAQEAITAGRAAIDGARQKPKIPTDILPKVISDSLKDTL